MTDNEKEQIRIANEEMDDMHGHNSEGCYGQGVYIDDEKFQTAQREGATKLSKYLADGLFLKATIERENMADREARMTERIGA